MISEAHICSNDEISLIINAIAATGAFYQCSDLLYAYARRGLKGDAGGDDSR